MTEKRNGSTLLPIAHSTRFQNARDTGPHIFSGISCKSAIDVSSLFAFCFAHSYS